MRFNIDWSCLYILISLMYLNLTVSYDTVAKPTVKGAALCLHCEKAETQNQEHRL